MKGASGPGGRVAVSSVRLQEVMAHMQWSVEDVAEWTGISVRQIKTWTNRKYDDANCNIGTYGKLISPFGMKYLRQFDRNHRKEWVPVHELGMVARKLTVGHLPIPADPDLFVGRMGDNSPMQALQESLGGTTGIVQVVAAGGIGKSTLTFHFMEQLKQDGYPQIRSVIDWSFYSQGQHDYQTDSQKFFRVALEHFSAFEPSLISHRNSDSKQIAQAVADIYCRADVGGLIVLDGVEPLQYPTFVYEGRIKDAGLREFLGAVAAHPKPKKGGRKRLIVITTRWRCGQLTPRPDGSVREVALLPLTPEEGSHLLKRVRLRDDAHVTLRSRTHPQGSEAEQREFEHMAKDLGGHPLSLMLWGTFLLAYTGGYLDLSLPDGLGSGEHAADASRHAARVLRDYARLFQDSPTPRGRACLQILYVLGLWDRPSPLHAIRVITQNPIPGVTDLLTPYGLMLAIGDLQNLRFLTNAASDEEIEVHPIVRDYFAKELQRTLPAAWESLHSLIFRMIAGDQAIAHEPADQTGLEPLFHAVVHGCKAGLHEEALNEVLIPRILRGSKNYAAAIGAVGSLVTTLAHFFAPDDWGQPLRRGLRGGNLTPDGEMKVLALAGLYLSASKGYGSEVTRQVYCGPRVGELLQNGVHSSARIHFLYGLWRVVLARGELAKTYTTAISLRDSISAQTQDDGAGDGLFVRDESDDLGVAHRVMAVTLMWMGRFGESEGYAREGSVSPSVPPEKLSWLFTEPGIICQGVLAIDLLHLGREQEAIEAAAGCVERGRLLKHPHTLSVALYMKALVHFFLRDVNTVRSTAAELVDLTGHHQFPFWLGSGLVFQGWVDALAGQVAAGRKQVIEGIKLWRSTGAEINHPIWVGVEAEITAMQSVPKAITRYKSAVADCRKRGELWCLPYLLLSLARLERAERSEAWRATIRCARDLAGEQGSVYIERLVESDFPKCW